METIAGHLADGGGGPSVQDNDWVRGGRLSFVNVKERQNLSNRKQSKPALFIGPIFGTTFLVLPIEIVSFSCECLLKPLADSSWNFLQMKIHLHVVKTWHLTLELLSTPTSSSEMHSNFRSNGYFLAHETQCILAEFHNVGNLLDRQSCPWHGLLYCYRTAWRCAGNIGDWRPLLYAQ